MPTPDDATDAELAAVTRRQLHTMLSPFLRDPDAVTQFRLPSGQAVALAGHNLAGPEGGEVVITWLAASAGAEQWLNHRAESHSLDALDRQYATAKTDDAKACRAGIDRLLSARRAERLLTNTTEET